MAIVIIINQKDRMIMSTRKHSQKISIKTVKQKRRYTYTW